MAAPSAARALAAPAPRSGLSAWLALLPVRVDDRRFWPRLALGLLLRWLVLGAEWRPVRAVVTRAVAWTLHAAGLSLDVVAADRLSVAAQGIAITVSCIHLDVFALVCPLLWDRSRPAQVNLGRLAALGLALLAIAVARIALAIALFAQGVPWILAHDALLGVGYFAVLALTLKHGAWTRPALTEGGAPGAGAARPPPA
jgi:hypothetical protein